MRDWRFSPLLAHSLLDLVLGSCNPDDSIAHTAFYRDRWWIVSRSQGHEAGAGGSTQARVEMHSRKQLDCEHIFCQGTQARERFGMQAFSHICFGFGVTANVG